MGGHFKDAGGQTTSTEPPPTDTAVAQPMTDSGPPATEGGSSEPAAMAQGMPTADMLQMMGGMPMMQMPQMMGDPMAMVQQQQVAIQQLMMQVQTQAMAIQNLSNMVMKLMEPMMQQQAQAEAEAMARHEAAMAELRKTYKESNPFRPHP